MITNFMQGYLLGMSITTLVFLIVMWGLLKSLMRKRGSGIAKEYKSKDKK